MTRFYQQCLNRQPDAAGLNAWTNDLLSGARTGADVARGFILSQEFINRRTTDEQFLTIMYRAFFNREPDAGGYNTWLNNIRNGASRESVVYGFTHAPEFTNLCNRYNIRPY